MIYLLEDDDSIREFVVYTLNSQGMESRGFALPSAFWAAVAERVPSLALLDVMLPEEDGLSVLKKLRAAPATAKLPVIMLTARGRNLTRSWGWTPGQTTMWPSPLGCWSCSPASGPCCGGQRRSPRRSAAAPWRWTRRATP